MPRSASPKHVLALAASAALLAACGPAKLDIRDPKSVALTFVDAYNRRDVQGLVQLVTPAAREEFEGPLTQGKESPDWQIVFGSGLSEGFAASKGVEGPRYDKNGMMVFGVSRDAEGRVLTTQVFKVFGAYYVGEIRSYEGAEFDAMPVNSQESPARSPGNDS